MSDLLREPGFLTAHQLRAVHPERDIFLTACPGSGKTRAAAVRIARLDDDDHRMAGCSYTNVGVEQDLRGRANAPPDSSAVTPSGVRARCAAA